MNYNIKAKETFFEGKFYRSRLEAKWQCIFNLLGWESIYEPCEINGFNPDFILKCNSVSYNTNNIIVEVKPSIFIDEQYKKSILNKYKNTNSHILILDENPFRINYNGYVELGVGIQYNGDGLFYDSMVMKSQNDFCSEIFLWDGIIHGKDERKEFLTEYNKIELSYFRDIINMSTNLTRFII